MSNLLICGMVVYDLVFDVTDIPSLPAKYVANDVLLTGGGCAANAAIAAARLGANVRLAGRVGDDVIGDMIIGHLGREQIDCTMLRRITGARSGFSAIAVDPQGERQILNFRGENLDVDPHWINQATGLDVILADNRWEAGAVAAMRLARSTGVPGVLDAEAPPCHAAMALASHIAFSRQGLEALANTDDLAQGLTSVVSEYEAWMCVTDGANGVFSMDNNQVKHTEAYPIEAVDTLGAGDVWHGAFCVALAEKHTETEAIRYANAVAALKCLYKGGGSSTPTSDAVEQFLSSHT